MAHTEDVTSLLVTVVELEPFTVEAAKLWSEEERLEFIGFIAENPEAGRVIPGTGGIRKVRWSRQGIGRRGGARVIYYYHSRAIPLFLLTVYAKSHREDVSPSELKQMGRTIAELKASYGKDQGNSRDNRES